MKVRLHIVLLLMTATLLIVSPGCEKVFDYIHQHPGEENKLCRIQKLKDTFGTSKQVFAINYNAAGNPTDIVCITNPITGGSTNSFEYHFRYDKYNRLSDYYFNIHGSTGVFVWRRFSYPDSKTIVDTAYEYIGFITDPVPPHTNLASVRIYSLDEWGRIIKTTQPGPDDYPPFITNYTYDMHGNLVLPNVVYDNKINLFRTNKVWMFIFNNYSVNNALAGSPIPAKITSYNTYGLPLKFSQPNNYGELFNYFYNTLEIEYACDEGGVHY